MMKRISIITILFISQFTIAQSKKFYVLKKDQKDTLLFDEVKMNWPTKSIKCKANGITTSFKWKDIKAYSTIYKNGSLTDKNEPFHADYIIKSLNPQKNKEEDTPFVTVIKSGLYRILHFEDSDKIRTHLYMNENFVEELSGKNYRKLCNEHFKDCPEFLLKVNKERLDIAIYLASRQGFQCK